MIQFMSCSNETEQKANPPIDSTQQVTPQPAYNTAANGDEIVPPIVVSAAEVKKALLDHKKWLQFGIIPVHKADNPNFAKYNQQDNEKMKEPVEEFLIFSSPDKYIREKGKDSKENKSGTFEVTDQYILVLNDEKKGNLNGEKYNMVSLSKDRFILVDTFSVEQVKFPVYKMYLRTE